MIYYELRKNFLGVKGVLFREVKGVLFREVKGVKEVIAGCRLLEVKDKCFDYLYIVYLLKTP